MSFAAPSSTVAMPAASSSRAINDRLWWHTGQLATSIAASTASSWQRFSKSGASTRSVWRWLRLVGTPCTRAAIAPMRPAARARRKAAIGYQVALSSLRCARSMATCDTRRSWSSALSSE